VLERTPGTKDIEVRVLPEGGTREAEVPAELVRALCLGDKQLRELHALAMRCEKAFGGAQDLEWAFAGGTLYLLQRRAVTSAMKKGTRGSVKVVSRRSQLITRALSHLDYSAYLWEK
jgi:pyruvate, water dikinase